MSAHGECIDVTIVCATGKAVLRLPIICWHAYAHDEACVCTQLGDG